jgi:hypothetical protein
MDDLNFEDLFGKIGFGSDDASKDAGPKLAMFFSSVVELIKATIIAGKELNLHRIVLVPPHVCVALVKIYLFAKREKELLYVLIYVKNFLGIRAYDLMIKSLSKKEIFQLLMIINKEARERYGEDPQTLSKFYEDTIVLIKESLEDPKSKFVSLPSEMCQSMIDHYADIEDYETCETIKEYLSVFSQKEKM